jgi:hypothetical protein
VNDAETLRELIMPATSAALLAICVHFLTASGEPRGFRSFPAGEREWLRYWLRSVTFMSVGSVIVSLHRNAHPLANDIAGGFLVLSFFSSLVFSAVDRSLCVRSMIVNAVTFLLVLFDN